MEFVDVRLVELFRFLEQIVYVDALLFRNAFGVWVGAEAGLPKDVEMFARRGSRPTELGIRVLEIVGIRAGMIETGTVGVGGE